MISRIGILVHEKCCNMLKEQMPTNNILAKSFFDFVAPYVKSYVGYVFFGNL